MAQTPALFFKQGDVIDYTPGSAVTAGDVIVLGTIIAVATQDIAANAKGALTITGIFKFPKTTDTFTAGDAVYWDADGSPVTGTASSGAADSSAATGNLAGWAVFDAETSDSYVYVSLNASKRVATIGGAVTASDITAEDASLGIAGLAAAQGGAILLTGGTSSTGANAGGAVGMVGGTPGATGVGGAVTLTGGAGGATSGVGGAATIAAGAGTAGNSAGGVASVTGGAGQGSAAGGIGKLVGGVGGATGAGGAVQLTGGAGGATSGTGGAVAVAGGAGSAGNAVGGSVTINGGAKNGSGTDGTVTIQSAYAPVAGGGTSAAILCSSTALLGVYFGTGAPTFSAAKGSLYIKTDASTSATRLYIASDAVGTWTAFTSAA